jgi:hypothetical protein
MQTPIHESLRPEDLEATLRIEAVRTAEELINQVSDAPDHPYGEWKVGVMPDDNGVIFGRGGGDLYQPAQSIILKKLGPSVHVHAYDRRLTGPNDFELRTWHSIIAESGDVHEAGLESTKEHLKTPVDAETREIAPFTISDVHTIIHSIAGEQGKQTDAEPRMSGWLQLIKLVTK